MVRPTPTSEVIRNIRVPPDKGKKNSAANRRTLQDDLCWGTPPSSPTPTPISCSGENVNKGENTGDKNDKNTPNGVNPSQQTSKPAQQHVSLFAGIKRNKFTRDRSESTKRKNSTEGNNNSKSARLEEPDCMLLRTVHENNLMYENIMDDLAETVSLDHTVSSVLKALTKGMKDSNEILGILLAERLENRSEQKKEKVSPVVIVSDDDCFPVLNTTQKNNGRQKPLQQAPLGGENWSTVVNKKGKKANNTQGNQGNKDTAKVPQETNVVSEEKSPFNAAIKDAERSLLIFNLNMGQFPCMNPTTISNKVTSCLLALACKAEGSADGSPSTAAKEIVDDVLGMVTKMDLFGTKTAPCKIPGKPSENGSFFTVPVKLMFKDRRVAQSAAEILRKHLNLNSTTPYHRSLRAAINLAIAKTKVRHPGYQARVTVDSSKKLLKCFIRPDTINPGNWSPAEKNIPIPPDAMDPSTRDTKGMTLPTSPVSKVATPTRQHKTGEEEGGNGSRSSSGDIDELNLDGNLPPLPDFMQDNADSRRKSVFGGTIGKTPRTPPPSSGKSGHASFGGEQS
jgi:hypothetical protein